MPDQDALAGRRLPVERDQLLAERVDAVVPVDVGVEIAHADLGQGVGHAPRKTVDVAGHGSHQRQPLLPCEGRGTPDAAAQHLLVQQFRQVKAAGGQFHRAFLHRPHQLAPLFGAGRGQELLDLPKAFASELEAAGGVAFYLGRRARHLQRLANELRFVIGEDLLLISKADVNVAVLDDEDGPFPRGPLGSGRLGRLGGGQGAGCRGRQR